MSEASRKVTYLGNILLVVVSLIFGFAFAEAGYRAYLYVTVPEKFLVPWQRKHPAFGLYNVSHWEYDEKLGFRYPPGRKISLTMIADGKVQGCVTFSTINKRGNIGPIKGKYEDAKVKVLVFGDSFPAFILKGITFPSKLQDILAKRLGKSVHVVNFGRDGTGVLQIFDMAAAKIPEWKPDFVIITFTTDDLDRVRIWRTATTVNGEPRILTTVTPDSHPPLDRAQDTFVVEPRATKQWCENTKAKGGKDPLVKELEYRYRRFAREAGYWFPDPLSLTHSFLLARIIYRDPFYTGTRESFTIPRVPFDDYGKDAQFLKRVAAVEKTGVPYIIVHLPLSDEVETGKEAILTGGREKLWKSLERITGKKIYNVIDYIDMPLKDPHRMDASKTNKHPSPWGMNLYANAITEMIVRNELIK